MSTTCEKVLYEPTGRGYNFNKNYEIMFHLMKLKELIK
jgi:hypothetical protein